jgi:hypothetical protein
MQRMWLSGKVRALRDPTVRSAGYGADMIQTGTSVASKADRASADHSHGEAMSSERKGLWIEVRDSETGERHVSIYAAPIPRSRTDRERFLNRYVPQILPGAKLRTYSGGTATFLMRHLLIRAHYGAVHHNAELLPLEEKLPEPVAASVGQGTLFAA